MRFRCVLKLGAYILFDGVAGAAEFEADEICAE